MEAYSASHAKERARQKAEKAQEEAAAMKARMDELEKQMTEAEQRREEREQEMLRQRDLANKKAEERIARVMAEAEAEANRKDEEARLMQETAQKALAKSREKMSNAQETAEQAAVAAQAASEAMKAATDEQSRAAAQREMEVAKQAEEMAQATLEAARSDASKLKDEAEQAAKRMEEQLADTKLEMLLQKEKAEVEVREAKARVEEEAAKKAKQVEDAAREADERVQRELASQKSQMQLEVAKAKEQALLAEGATQLQTKAAYDERIKAAEAAHAAAISAAKAEMSALTVAKDEAEVAQASAALLHRNGALRRAAAALRAFHHRDVMQALKEWQVNLKLARERERMEELLEKARAVQEPKDQVEMFMAEQMKEVQAAQDALKKAQADAEAAKKKAKAELAESLSRSEARQAQLEEALKAKEAAVVRQQERNVEAAAAAEAAKADAAAAATEAVRRAKSSADAKVAAAQERLEHSKIESATGGDAHTEEEKKLAQEKLDALSAELLAVQRQADEAVEAARQAAEADAARSVQAAQEAQERAEGAAKAAELAAKEERERLEEAKQAEVQAQEDARMAATKAAEDAAHALEEEKAKAEAARKEAESKQSEEEKKLAEAWARTQEERAKAEKAAAVAAMQAEKAVAAQRALKQAKEQADEAEYEDVEAGRTARIALAAAEKEMEEVKAAAEKAKEEAEAAREDSEHAARAASQIAMEKLQELPTEQQQVFEQAAVQDAKRFQAQVASEAPAVKAANRKAVIRRCRRVMNAWRFKGVQELMEMWMRNMFIDKELEKVNAAASNRLSEIKEFSSGSKEDQLAHFEQLTTEKRNLEAEVHKRNTQIKKSQIHLFMLLSRLCLIFMQKKKWEFISRFKCKMMQESHDELHRLQKELAELAHIAQLRSLKHVVSLVVNRWSSVGAMGAVNHWRSNMIADKAAKAHAAAFNAMKAEHNKEKASLEDSKAAALEAAKLALSDVNDADSQGAAIAAMERQQKASEELVRLQQQITAMEKAHALQRMGWILRHIQMSSQAACIHNMRAAMTKDKAMQEEQERNAALLSQAKKASALLDDVGSDSKDFEAIQAMRKRLQTVTLHLLLSNRLRQDWKKIAAQATINSFVLQAMPDPTLAKQLKQAQAEAKRLALQLAAGGGEDAGMVSSLMEERDEAVKQVEVLHAKVNKQEQELHELLGARGPALFIPSPPTSKGPSPAASRGPSPAVAHTAGVPPPPPQAGDSEAEPRGYFGRKSPPASHGASPEELQAAEAHVARLEALLGEKESQIRSLEATVRKHGEDAEQAAAASGDEQVAALTKRLSEATSRVHELEKELSAAKTATAALENSMPTSHLSEGDCQTSEAGCQTPSEQCEACNEVRAIRAMEAENRAAALARIPATERVAMMAAMPLALAAEALAKMDPAVRDETLTTPNQHGVSLLQAVDLLSSMSEAPEPSGKSVGVLEKEVARLEKEVKRLTATLQGMKTQLEAAEQSQVPMVKEVVKEVPVEGGSPAISSQDTAGLRQASAFAISEHILKRLAEVGNLSWGKIAPFYYWRSRAVARSVARKLERQRAELSAKFERHGDAEAAALATLREENAKRLAVQQAAAKREKERLEEERQEALKDAENALASLAAAGGDDSQVQKLLQRQAEASQRLTAFKEELRQAHMGRLSTAMRHVFKQWEDQHLMHLVHVWYSEFSTWREAEERRKEIEKAVKAAVDVVQKKLDAANKELEKVKRVSQNLKLNAMKAGKHAAWSLYVALGRHAVTAQRSGMEMWCSFVGERRSTRHLNELIQEQLAELVKAHAERDELAQLLNEARGRNIALMKELEVSKSESTKLMASLSDGSKDLYKQIDRLTDEVARLTAALQKATAEAKKNKRELIATRAHNSTLQAALDALKREMEDRKGDADKLAQMFDAASSALADERGDNSAVNQALLQVHWIVCKMYTLLFNSMKKSKLTSMENPLSSDWKMEEESSLLRRMEVSQAADVVQWDHKMLEKAYTWLRLKLVEQEIALDPLRGSSLHGSPAAQSFAGNPLRSSPLSSLGAPISPYEQGVVALGGGGPSVVDSLNIIRNAIDKPAPPVGMASTGAGDNMDARAEFFSMLRRRLEELGVKLRSRMESDPTLRAARDAPSAVLAPRPATSQGVPLTRKRDVLFDPLAPSSNIWSHHKGGRTPDNRVLAFGSPNERLGSPQVGGSPIKETPGQLAAVTRRGSQQSAGKLTPTRTTVVAFADGGDMSPSMAGAVPGRGLMSRGRASMQRASTSHGARMGLPTVGR